jgi:hypothetical protein
MDYAAVAVAFHRITHMQHLVEHQVLDQVPGHLGSVERAADGDTPMCGIVVTEESSRALRAPAHPRGAEVSPEVATVQLLKNLLQVEVPSAWREDSFAAPPTACLVDPATHSGIEDVSQVTGPGFTRRPPAEKLAQQDFRQGFEHQGWCFRQQV